jgi:uncharacterized protein YbjQ (UPF0145 family)
MGVIFIRIFTTSTVLGETVEKHMGLVTGESLIGANLYKDMLGEVKGVVKKQQSQYEVQLIEARRIAIESMKEKAEKMGANAIIGTRVEYNNLGGSMGNTMMVTVTGTAVQVTAP